MDDQIWTNSKFKLCLKVQNEADSKEVLHTPDAANITQVGRAYLQVGNNEIYELFQSAWSGAAYVDEAEKEVTQDNRVYLVNELGQGMLINQDLRGTKEERKARKTQLDVVVEHIRKVYDAEACVKVSRPWLPSLPERICNPYREMPRGKETSLRVRLGIVDIPEEQKQEEYVLDLVRDGNVAYIASSGYGKSVFLANVALDLAVHNQVRDLNLYILDFGNNALIAFKSLPHTADYIMLDDAEKFKKFRGLMTAETTRRKKLLAEAMVQNFAVYNEVSQTPLKAIAILIDNYDAVREMGYETENYFTKLSRDGTGLGIYIIMAASRTSAVRAATMNNFKNKIAGYNFEENEVKSLVGKSAYTLPDIRGRAMVKTGEQGNLLQLYTPVDFRDEVEYSKNLQAFINEVREKYPGEEAPHIPVLPEKADYESIAKESDSENICLGLDWETVETRKITPDNTPFLILGEAGSGKTNVLRIILDALKGIPDVYLIDSRSRNLYEYREQVHYLSGKQEIDAFANAILEEKTKRQNQLKNGLLEKKTPEEILRKMAPYYVVVDDIDDFCMQAEAEVNIIGSRFEQAAMQGIRFIATADINRFKGTDSFTKYLKSARDGMFLSNPGFQPVLPAKPTETLGLEDGFLIIGGKGNYIRIPKAGTKGGQNKRREA